MTKPDRHMREKALLQALPDKQQGRELDPLAFENLEFLECLATAYAPNNPSGYELKRLSDDELWLLEVGVFVCGYVASTRTGPAISTWRKQCSDFPSSCFPDKDDDLVY